MKYVPQGPAERAEMLERIGVTSVADLFSSIPESLRREGKADIPPALSEVEMRRFFEELGAQNANVDLSSSFRGAGCYAHYSPATIDTVLARGEFLTSYTPYQPEVAQGTLISIFEWQTQMCLLTGMEVANASLYDGASALPEGVFLAARSFREKEGRNKVVLSAGVHPHYRQVLETYGKYLELELVTVPLGADGRTDAAALAAAVDQKTCAVAIQSPNVLGVVEGWTDGAAAAHAKGAKLVAVVAEAISLGLLSPPGEAGADIVVGEASSFGIGPAFGGPALGFLACRDELKRQMPGRLCGETKDSEGQRAFTLTLSTREQHIRREKATSNICTNQGLMALAANVYLCTLGKAGVAEVARQSHAKAEYLKSLLKAVPGVRVATGDSPTFNEFALEFEGNGVGEGLCRLAGAGIAGGVPLRSIDPRGTVRGNDVLLVATTELNTRDALDRYAAALRG